MATGYPRRIMGVETEFGIAAYDGARQVLAPEEIARYLFRPVVAAHRSSNVYVANAARLYLDVGSHPEYATAECDGLRQLIAYDKAGERVVDDLAVEAERMLAEQSILAKVFILSLIHI